MNDKKIGVYGMLIIPEKQDQKEATDRIVKFIEEQGWEFSGNTAEIAEWSWKQIESNNKNQ